MNVSADALTEASRGSAEAAADAARRTKWRKIRAPRNQPTSAKPGIPGPVATCRSRSLAFNPARLVGGCRRKMLNKRESSAVASAEAAIAVREPRNCQKTDINSRAMQIVADVINQLVPGWSRTTIRPQTIMTTAPAKIARLNQRA